jgi:hypothetical protein
MSYENARASPNPYVQERVDLIASIKAGQPLDEGRLGARLGDEALDLPVALGRLGPAGALPRLETARADGEGDPPPALGERGELAGGHRL